MSSKRKKQKKHINMRQTVRQVFIESSASSGKASDKIFKVKGLALLTGFVLLSSRFIPSLTALD